MKIKKIIKTLIIAGAIVAFACIAGSMSLETTVYDVRSAKIKRPFRIAQLSDLHGYAFGDNQSEIMAALSAQPPDIVVMTGDIFDDRYTPDDAWRLIGAVAAAYPCWFVSGNHELEMGRWPEYKAGLLELGVKILDGNFEAVAINGKAVNICGVGDPYPLGNSARLGTAFKGADGSSYTILLAHRPERFEDYAKYPCDLVLSGHAHGGQWRLPPVLDQGMWAPNQGFFPKLTSGVHKIGDTTMIISRGLPKGPGLIPRIFNRPEIVIINVSPIAA